MRLHLHPDGERGVSVVEVLIALGMAGIIISSVGGVVLSIERIDRDNALKESAIEYARQSLEIVGEQRNTLFACSCNSGGDCSVAGKCTKAGIGTCDLASGYTLCWPSFNGEVTAGLPAVDPRYTRKVTAENWQRGDTGVLDANVKKVTATISWTDRGVTKQTVLTTVVSAWKNL